MATSPMSWEVEEKLRAEQNPCNQQARTQTVGYAADVCNKQEMHVHRLLRRRMNVESDTRKLDRVIDILQRHPEFEELIEVINSGLLY